MLTIRHATPAELEEPVGFTVTDPVGSVEADRLRREAAAGRCRPEWTWFAVDGAERITATTDVVNAPMAAAFERAGYRVTEVRTVFSAPTG